MPGENPPRTGASDDSVEFMVPILGGYESDSGIERAEGEVGRDQHGLVGKGQADNVSPGDAKPRKGANEAIGFSGKVAEAEARRAADDGEAIGVLPDTFPERLIDSHRR